MAQEQALKFGDFLCGLSILHRRGVFRQATVGDSEIPLPCLECQLRLGAAAHLRPRTLERSHSFTVLIALATELKPKLLGCRINLLRSEKQAGQPQPELAKSVVGEP